MAKIKASSVTPIIMKAIKDKKGFRKINSVSQEKTSEDKNQNSTSIISSNQNKFLLSD